MYQLWRGDCLKFMGQMEPGSVDCVIADLPYGITQCEWDIPLPLDQLWDHWKRLLKPKGSVVLFGKDPFSSDLMISNREWYKFKWVWNKRNVTSVLNAKRMPLQHLEDILVFAPDSITYNPQGLRPVMKMKSQGKSVDTYGKRSEEPYFQEYTNYPRQLLSFPKSKHGMHPTQKPLNVMTYLIRTHSNPGETIFDPTMGSGSTGVAAVLEGRTFIGMELDSQYFKLAKERINEACTMEKVVTIGTEVTKQTTLFEVSDKSIDVTLRNVKTN